MTRPVGVVRPAVAALLVAAASLLTFGMVPSVDAAGTYQGSTTANTAGAAATSLVLPVPTGTALNDVLLAQVDVGGGSTITITPPAGWTLVGSVNSGATAAVDIIQSIYWRAATASEPASYAWTFTSGRAAGAMLRYSGIDTDIPIDAVNSAFTSATGTNPSAPAATARYGDETVVHFVGKNSASTFVPSAGTERTDSGNVNPGTESFDETQALSGATTARTATATPAASPASVVGQTVALRTQAAIKLRGVTLPLTTAPANTVALTPPAGTVQRDVMIAQIVSDSASTVTAPSGWVQIATQASAGTTASDLRQTIYYKVAGATETGAYTFTDSPPKGMDGALFVYAGVDNTNPTDGTAASQVATTGTTATAPAITTTKANDMLLGFFAGGAGSSDPFSQPANMNERVDTGQTPVVSMAAGDFAFAADDRPLGAAGAVAAFTSALSGGNVISIGTTVALRPADVAFSAATANAFETAGAQSITVSQSGALSTTTTVAYAVTGGTATGGGTDYTLASGTATIAAGSTSTTVSLTIVDDQVPDGGGGTTALDETVIITLSSPRNANLGAQATHTFTIKDDEPKISILTVNSAGGTLAVAWGGWTALAGATNVASTNYLKVANTDPDPAARPVVTVDFTGTTFVGQTDAAVSLPLDGNIQFSCKEDTTGASTPGALTFPAFGAASASGSTTVTFTATTGSVWYCRHQLASVPIPTLDQDYGAAYTVVAV